jgi:hypothetical protein
MPPAMIPFEPTSKSFAIFLLVLCGVLKLSLSIFVVVWQRSWWSGVFKWLTAVKLDFLALLFSFTPTETVRWVRWRYTKDSSQGPPESTSTPKEIAWWVRWRKLTSTPKETAYWWGQRNMTSTPQETAWWGRWRKLTSATKETAYW